MEDAVVPMALQLPVPHRGLGPRLQAKPKPFISGRWVQRAPLPSSPDSRDLRWPCALLIFTASTIARSRRCKRKSVQLSSQSSIAPVPPKSGGLGKLWSCVTFAWVSALMRRGNRPPPIGTIQLLPAPSDMHPVCKRVISTSSFFAMLLTLEL